MIIILPDVPSRMKSAATIFRPTSILRIRCAKCLKSINVVSGGEGYKTGESYGIPYCSLIPRYTENLLVCGRCISCDRYVFASVRVILGCFITGQAAGFVSALSVEKKCSPKELDPNQLRTTMSEHKALLQ